MCKSISTVCAVLVLLALTATTAASVPHQINYQGFLTDDQDVPLDTLVSITVTLYDDSAGTTSIWSDTYDSVSIADGLFDLILGSKIALPATVFSGPARYIGIQIDGGATFTPLTPLVSVGYAVRAEQADTATYAHTGAWQNDSSGWTDTGTRVVLTDTTDMVAIGTTFPQANLHVDGTMRVTSNVSIGLGHGNIGYQSFVMGEGDTVSGNYAAILGGTLHKVSGDYSATLGGRANWITAPYAAIAGGADDTAIGVATFVAGINNTARGHYSTVAGGSYSETVSDYAAIGGGRNNIAEGAYATIAGGGPSDPGNPTTTSNKTFDDYAAIGGGAGNRAGTDNGSTTAETFATVAGGLNNSAGAAYSAVGGGNANTASGYVATVSGGNSNSASANYSGVASGSGNVASAANASIGGGGSNTASVTYARIGGGRDNNAAGAYSTIAGGYNNAAAGNFSTVAGGVQNVITGAYSAILGGFGDTIDVTASHSYLFGIGSKLTQDSTLMIDMPHVRIGDESTGYELPSIDGLLGEVLATDGSGQLSWNKPTRWTLTDTVLYTDQYWGIARGGAANEMRGDSAHTLVNLGVQCRVGNSEPGDKFGQYASVTGGKGNGALGYNSHIGGGANNEVGSRHATIAGGAMNHIMGNPGSAYSFIGGGNSDTISGVAAVICGGDSNRVAGSYSFIGGGHSNRVDSFYSCIGGGRADTITAPYGFIGGGWLNNVTGKYGVVGGGFGNFAEGYGSCVPGGYTNYASGDYSFAAGHDAQALHSGSVVIAANPYDTAFWVESGCQGQMVLYAADHIYLTDTLRTTPCIAGRFINTSTGGYLSTSGDWTNASDRDTKENFAEIDTESLLDKVAQLPISEWNYKRDEDNVKHIGPVAQDFHELFGVGADDKTISTIDPAGIALAAIQELYKKTQQLEAQRQEIKDLRTELAMLRNAMEQILPNR